MMSPGGERPEPDHPDGRGPATGPRAPGPRPPILPEDLVELEPDQLAGEEPPLHPPGVGPRPPLWTRDFILLVAANLLLFLGFQMLLPTLPVYAVDLGGDDAAAGLIIGLFTASAVLIRPAAGWALDAYGRRPIFVLGLAIFIATVLGYEFVGTVALLLTLRFVHGFGWGMCTTAGGTLAADLVPRPRLGEGMGWFGMAATISMAVAPAVGLLIIDRSTFGVLFVASAGLAFAALILVLVIRYPRVERASGRPGLDNLVAREALRPALVTFFVTMTYGAVVAFIALFAAEEGVDNVGPFFTVYAIVLTLVRPWAGRTADRAGYDRVMLPGLVAIGLALVALALAHTLPLFLLAAVLYGAGFGAVQPSLQALSVLRVTPQRRGAASATFFSAFDLGIGAGSILGGIIAQTAGYQTMYLLGLVPAAIALAVYRLGGAGRP